MSRALTLALVQLEVELLAALGGRRARGGVEGVRESALSRRTGEGGPQKRPPQALSGPGGLAAPREGVGGKESMKAVLIILKNGKLVRRERRFPDWKAYEAFLEALARGRWARTYRSGAYLEARRQGLYLEVLGREEG